MDEELELTILDVRQIGESLQIKVETEYGIVKIGVSAKKKYLNPKTGKPMWLSEVKEKIEKLYAHRDKDTKIVTETPIYKDLVGKKVKLKDVEDLTSKEKHFEK